MGAGAVVCALIVASLAMVNDRSAVVLDAPVAAADPVAQADAPEAGEAAGSIGRAFAPGVSTDDVTSGRAGGVVVEGDEIVDVFPNAAAPPRVPNIVIINLDDARFDVMDVLPKTVEWFGDEGITFENAFVSTPSCCPSRATLMTGQYVHNNGQVDQDTPLTDESISIQRYLSDAGYFTGHVGKYLHYYELMERAPYWDRWAYYRGGYENVPFNIDGEFVRSTKYSTVETFDLAIEQLESFDSADDDRPFYLHIAPVAPHRPYTPEPKFADAPVPTWDPSPAVAEADRSDKPRWVSFHDFGFAEGDAARTQQLRMLMSVDEQVDRFMSRLTELGEANDTVAIFTSDNGYLWSEHGRRGKFVPYVEAIKVPFLVRWPGVVEAGESRDELISHVDILSTVLAAAELAPAHPVDGRDILAPGFSRANIFTEYFLDPANNNGIPDWASVRNEERAFTQWFDADGRVIFEEYYDLIADPYELDNLLGNESAADDPDVGRDRALVQQAKTCVGRFCP